MIRTENTMPPNVESTMDTRRRFLRYQPALLPKAAIVACLAIAWSITFPLLGTYLTALGGGLQGAGAAQWQFGFLIAPIPFALSLLALAIAWLARRSLSRRWALVSSLSALVPALLFGLVFFHVY